MVIRIAACAIEMAITLYFFNIIFQKIPDLCGWNHGQINFLICTYEIIYIMLISFFIKSLPKLEDFVTEGKLDLYIIKPASSQFIISFQNISFGHMAQIFIPLIVLYKQMNKYNMVFDFISVIKFIFSLVFGFFIGYSLWTIVVSISFWTVKTKSLHEIYLNIMGLTKYPAKIYPSIASIFLKYFFPVLFIASIPSEVILFNNNVAFIEAAVVSLFCVLASNFIWKCGIDKYTSTGG